MIVYGKHRKKYVLSAAPVSQEYDGAVYSVPAEPDYLVKIYQQEYRTPETERHVIDTVNGTSRMIEEFPVDVVYANGRFAGYIFERSAPEVPVEEPIDIPVNPAKPPRNELGNATALIISALIGICLSLLIYFWIFGLLEKGIGDPYCHWNFNGIPMIVGGWIVLFLAFFQFRDRGAQTVILSAVGFVLGAILMFALISLLVFLIDLVSQLFVLLLPSIIIVVVIICLIKSVLKR